MGLRVQMFPSIKDPSLDFKKSWETTLTNCSIEMMRSLIIQYTNDMTTLDSDIDRLNTQFEHLSSTPMFFAKWKELKDRLELMNKEIIVNK